MKIEDNGIGKLFDRMGEEGKQEAKKTLNDVAIAMMGGIKQDMPVDTGRARASWGIWTPQDISGPADEANEGDSYYAVKDDGATIEQGSNVEYIKELNEGSSTQAPAGFIDSRFKGAQDLLLKKVSELVDKLGNR